MNLLVWHFRYLWFACGFLLLLLIAIASLMPVSGDVGNDKLAHVIMYAIPSIWFSLLIERPGSLWRILLGLTAYGLLMEVFQGLTDYRSMEFADAVANSLGVLLGLGFYFTPCRRWLVAIDHRLYQLLQ
ncbi:MAG: VanZ family protein [Gammaproteobacteria bacterium]|nr:VanZ family protein [Gammaproteobacteria bacterium]